jgi:tetratricopeptide (TPR) repeat protein
LLDLLDALDNEHPFRSLDPPQHRQSTYQAVTRILLSESHVQPIVAVVEDLHWNDALTLGLLNELVVATQKARLLLIVTYRPEHRDEWQNRPNYHQLRLNPLVSESLEELLQALLGSDPSLPTLKSFLTERASGNPFFVEEIVRSLLDTGVLQGVRGRYSLAKPLPSIDVPPTVHAVLAARIDALPAAEKRLLEEAAVIGHDVPFTLLHAICGRTEDRVRVLLDNLQAAEFVYATQIFPDLQYTFKHSLTHDVAYSGVLHDRRRNIHARIVDAVERLYADRLGEQVERLAYHAVQSGLHEKAVRYLWQAGGKAAARSAVAEARAWLEQALDVLKALPEGRAALEQAFEIRLELRLILRQLGEGRRMLEYLSEAEVLAERLQDDRRRGLVCALMTTVHATLGELDEALATGTRALEIAGRLSDLRLRILTTSCLEQVNYYRGEYQNVVEFAPGILTALPAEWTRDHFNLAVPASVAARGWLIMSLAELGRFAEAANYVADATQIAKRTQHAFTISWAHFAASMLHLIQGDWAKARSRTEHWILMLRTANATIQLPWAIACSAWALAQTGAASEAQSRVREAEQLLERQEAGGLVAHRGWGYHAAGRACLLLGRIEEARRIADRAVESSRCQPGFAAYARCLLGDLATQPDRFDAQSGAANYQEALAIARLHGMRPLIAHCHHGLSKLSGPAGKTPGGCDHLATATRMYREMDMRFWLGQVQADTNPSVAKGRFGPPPRSSAPISSGSR